MLKRILFTLLITAFFYSCFLAVQNTPEWHTHSATWLQWPHDSTYYIGYRDFFEPAWIDMTLALDGSEQVFIIAYDSLELEHITSILADAGADMDSLQFFVFPNNDYWVRDNGPIFVLIRWVKPPLPTGILMAGETMLLILCVMSFLHQLGPSA